MDVVLYFDDDTDPTNDMIYVSSSINNATIIDDVADQGVLLVGEVETYTVVNNYTITAVDEESGRLINTVTVTAKNSEGEVVEDVSDNGIPGDGNEEDDETIINFAPNPELRVTKVDSISIDAINDGKGPETGDTILYTIIIENIGNVTLSGVTPTDEIRDGDGVLIGDGNLAIEYDDNYIGDNADIASSEGILISGERAVYTATYQITQEVEETGFVSNVVTVTANGPDDVGSITAVSDDPETEEEGDPTVTQMHASPNMTVVKTATVVDGDDETILAGDLIQFNITITNTGNVDLIDLTLEDTLKDGSGDTILTDGSALLPTLFSGSDQDSPRGSLKVGETATYLAYYLISPEVASTGSIHNQVLAKAKIPGTTSGFDVEVLSDDGIVETPTDNTTTDVYITADPSIEVTKEYTYTDNNSDGKIGQGDTINYEITIANTGNVKLVNLAVLDTIVDNNNNPLSLTLNADGDSLILSSGYENDELNSGAVAVYTATYVIEESAANSGAIINQAFVTAETAQGQSVADTSDNGDDTDGNEEDDPTITPIDANPGIEVIKTADITSNAVVNDTINYTITVKNIGNVNLTFDPTEDIFDKLTDGNSEDLDYTTYLTTSDDLSSIAPSETVTFTASFIVSAEASISGRVENRVTVFAHTLDGLNTVFDISDDGDTGDGDTGEDPTITTMLADPNIEVIKTQEIIDDGDGVIGGLSDLVKYTITVENTGNVDITNLVVTDVLSSIDLNNTIYDSSSPSDDVFFDGPYFIGSEKGASVGDLVIGDIATYLAFYRITQEDVDGGGISNTAKATGTSSEGNVEDDSDGDTDQVDGDVDGDKENDPTVLPITPDPGIEITKKAEVTIDDDGEVGVGDTITYTIEVTNTGNVTLTDVFVEDSMTAGDEVTVLDLTTPITPADSLTIHVGETKTYTATYEISQAAADSGRIINTATITGTTPSGDEIQDDSDDPTTTAENDPTIVTIQPEPLLEITKVAVVDDGDDDILGVGDTITYNIRVKNTGNTILTNVSILDTLTTLQGLSLSLDSIPKFVESYKNGAIFASTSFPTTPTLQVGEEVEFATTYTITLPAVNAGGVSNTVTATALDPESNQIEKTISEAVVNEITQTPELTVIKEYQIVHQPGTDSEISSGDTIVYTITVENTGNVTVTNITLTDELTDGLGNQLNFTSGGPTVWESFDLDPNNSTTLTASYSITQSVSDSGKVSNTATATGTTPTGGTVEDVSDDGDTSSGDTESDPTIVDIDLSPEISIEKTSDDPSDGTWDLGDTITYTIDVTNTGNVTLSDVTVTDILESLATPADTLSLTSGPAYSGTGTFDGVLDVGETVSYEATFEITQAAVDAGGVKNTASVTAKDSKGNPLTPVSDSETNTINRNADMSVAKTITGIGGNTDGKIGVGDVIQYKVVVTNEGNVTLTNIQVVDSLRLGSPTATPVDNAAYDSPAGVDLWTQNQTLLPGDSATYVAWYVIDDTAASSGQVINTATATADTPIVDSNGDIVELEKSDQISQAIDPLPSIAVTKEITALNDGGDGLDVGETVLYTITITNDGNTPLTAIDLDDTITDLDGTAFTDQSAVGLTYIRSSFDDDNNSETTTSFPDNQTLQPNEDVTYEALLTIDQSMIDAGGVVNTVSVSGFDVDEKLTADGSSPEVLIAAAPSFTVTKESDVVHVGSEDIANRVVRSEDMIDYVITITNTGNVTLTNLVVKDILTDGAGNALDLRISPGTGDLSQWTIASLAPEEVMTFNNVSYTIGETAALTGSISNTARVTATIPDGTEVTVSSEPEVVQTDLIAEITVTKDENLIGDGELGDVIDYTVVIENTGEVPVVDIEVIDSMTVGNGTTPLYLTSPPHSVTDNTPWELVTLEVGEKVTLSGFYVIDQPAIDSGSVINRVFATGSDPDGQDVTGDSVAITSISQSASILVTKTASPTTDNFIVGDTITYTIGVKNIGGVNLNTLNITDTLKDKSGVLLDLDGNPNADWTSYFTGSSFDDDGDSGTVTNFSTDTAYHTSDLQPNEEVTFTAIYIVDQDAIDAGGVENIVTVTATADDGDNTPAQDTTNEPVVTDMAQIPGISLTKEITNIADAPFSTGDIIRYSIVIENTGNVTLTTVTLTDDLTDGNGNELDLTNPTTFDVITLDPGEIKTIEASYTVEQPAADTGEVNNTASVVGTAPDGTTVDASQTDVQALIDLSPEISIEKTSDDPSDGTWDLGDTITYTIDVTNTGNVTLSDVTVTDILESLADPADVLSLTTGPAYSGTGTFDGVLDVGDTVSYEATFEITQAAVDAGGVKNTASVTAKDSKGNPLTPVSASADPNIINRNADMSIVKAITGIGGNTDGKIGVGDVIQYKVVVTNEGNVTLTNIEVVDSLRLGSPTATPVDNAAYDSPAGVDLWTQNQTLLPGESVTYVAWYVIDETAASSGQVINTATATADTPIVDDDNGDIVELEKSDQISQAIDPIPSIAVTKVVTTINDGGDGLDVGETVLYTITITNDGNTTLTGVSDPADTDIVKDINGVAFEQPYTNVVTYKGSSLDGSDPPAASFSKVLEAGEVVTFEALLTINQAMVDAGGVVNTVSVSGYNVDEQLTADASSDAIQINANPEFTVTKEAEVIHVGSEDASAPVTRAQDRIKYTISIVNAGNVTLDSLIVKDLLTDGAGNALSLDVSESPGDTATPNEWVIDSLLPGSSNALTYTVFYTIGETAALTGSIITQLDITATAPDGSDVKALSDNPDTSEEGDATVTPTDLIAEITVTKDENLIGDGELGDVIDYTVVIENTGEVPVVDIEVIDSMTVGNGTTPLYLTSPPHSVTDNTPWDLVTLEVGEKVTLSGFYVIDQPAIDSGSVINRVFATGSDPDGQDVTGDSVAITSISQSASILVTKTASPTTDNFIVGDTITYTIGVKNIGGVNLNTLNITDTLKDKSGVLLDLDGNPNADWTSYFTGSSFDDDGDSGTVTNFSTDTAYHTSDLQPNEEVTFTAIYIVDQDAIDAGGVENMVTVTATADDGDNTSALDTTNEPVVTDMAQTPGISLTKEITNIAEAPFSTGDIIRYSIVIENTGNVTLTGVTLTDDLTDGNGNELDLTYPTTFDVITLDPGEIKTIEASYTVDQPAADTGEINNTASVVGTAPDGTTVDASQTDVQALIDLSPEISIEKTSSAMPSDGWDKGDTITYTIDVTNTGNVTLSDVTVTDILESLATPADTLSLTSGPAYSGTGTFDGVLDVGETVSYEATFEITQAAVDAGGVKNTASVTAKDSKGNPLTPVSDSETNTINRNADMSVAKTITGIGGNTDGKIGVGDVIQYKVVVTNEGNVTLTNIQVVDSLRLGSPTATPVDNAAYDSPAGVDLWTQNQTLLPGDSATYVAWYVIDDTAASSGQVINTATATADTPIVDSNGDIVELEKSDQISQSIDPIPSIAVTKVVTTPNDGGDGLDVGETVLYTIKITNDGNTTLTAVSDPADTDIVKDISGVAFEQPYTNVVTYKGSSLDGSDPPAASFSNILEAGEVVTFEALLTINQAMVDAGGVVNTVSVSGYNVDEQLTADASSDAIQINANPEFTVTKEAEVIHVGSDDASAPVTRAEDRIKYIISIENTGNVTLDSLIVKDLLTDGAGNALSLSESPGDTATPNEWVIDSLLPGSSNALTYTVFYTIGETAALTGSIINQVDITATAPDGSDVKALSDDPDTSEQGDATVTPTDLIAEITVTKDENLIGDGELGDVIDYTVVIENTGEVPVVDIEVIDSMTVGNGTTPLYLTSPSHSVTDNTPWDLVTLEVGEKVTLSGFYVIDQSAIDSGSVINRVFATGSDPDGQDVTGDSVAITSISQSASILVTKTASPTTDNFIVGDTITYTIGVKNIGGVNLNTLNITDTLKDKSGVLLDLDGNPNADWTSYFTGSSFDDDGDSGTVTNFSTDTAYHTSDLQPNEEVTFTAIYIVDQDAIDAGGVENIVTVTATADDGDNTPAQDTTNEPVVTDMAQIPGISLLRRLLT